MINRSVVAGMTIAAGLVAAPSPAHASFHLWEVKEVYSNASGSIQYIELFTTSIGQHVLTGHTITATSDLGTRTFTFPANSPTPTNNKHLLIATPGFTNIPGSVAPDFVLPCGPFFDPASATIVINFGMSSDILTITTPAVPTDGINSLTDSVLSGNTATLTAGASSPTNFAGSAGALALTTCLADGSCDACTDALFCNGIEVCGAGVCAGPDPCPVMCNEATDTCFECDDVGDCNDSNPCTDDVCDGTGTCVNTNNTLACDDNLFCTTTDACAGGSCVGTGDACPGQNCNEGLDQCGNCTTPAECDDSAFCNGAETCTANNCSPPTAVPCDPVTETCDEPTDVCQLICSDGTLDGAEACDDGNAVDGDGCSAACTIEDGFTCDVVTEPSVCTAIPPPDAAVPDAAIGPDAAGTGESGGCCSTGGALDAGTGGLAVVVGLALIRRRRPRPQSRQAA